MLVGYARVSTNDQDTALQLDALKAAGTRRIYHEKASSVGARPQLRRALSELAPGDVLLVWKLDRLARSLSDLLQILQALGDRQCGLRSLTEPIDTSTAMGVFVLQILGAVAQLERSMIRERAIAGQVAAYQRGVRWGGRKPTLSSAQAAEIRQRYQGGATQRELAEQYGVHRSTISRILNPSSATPREALPVLRSYLGTMVD